MSHSLGLETFENFPAPCFFLPRDAGPGASLGLPNARWRALFSDSPHWLAQLHPDHFGEWQKRLASETGPWQWEAKLCTPAGWTVCLIGVEPLEFSVPNGGITAGWLLQATDIGAVIERIEADCEQERMALRMTARQWSSFFQKSATGKAMIGLDGEFLVVNPELCRLIGYDEEALLQMAPHQLRYPADFGRIERFYRAIVAGGPPVSGVETRFVRGDGHVIHALVSISLVHDSRNQPLYFAVEMQDDTARREAEAALEEKVRELATSNDDLARSNAELERFAFIASHDLQEPLRKIRIFAGRLQKEATQTQMSEAATDYLTRLNSAAQRMQQLIADLLEFSRLRRPSRFETVDLTALARDAVADFDTLLDELGGTIRIEPLPTLVGDEARLRQLICNLVGNALKFRGQTPPVVEIWAAPAADPHQKPALNAVSPSAPNDVSPHDVSPHDASPHDVSTHDVSTQADFAVSWWNILVRDNGIGFDESDLPRLLEVFGRIHPRDLYPGTGIGLAICRKVAQEHSGDISARSQPGHGTTFIVSLPAVPRKSIETAPLETV